MLLAGFAENRLYDVITHFDQPVGRREYHGQNAGPFMTASPPIGSWNSWDEVTV